MLRNMRKLILFCGLLSLTVAGPTPGSENVHEIMTDAEVMQVFRTERHAIPEYEVVSIDLPRLQKRSYKLSKILHIKAFGQNIKLWLNPTEGILVGKDTPVYIAKSPRRASRFGKTKIQRVNNAMANVGEILEDLEKQSTMTVKRLKNGKNSISGTIGTKRLVIKPLPERINYHYNFLRPKRSVNDVEYLQNDTMDRDELNYHVVYKLPEQDPKANYAAMPKLESYRTRKIVPSKLTLKVPEVIYPQILIFIDYKTYKIHDKNMDKLLEYVLAFWNGVDLRYRSLQNPKIRFSIAGIVIAEDVTALPFISENMVSNDDLYISESLSDFMEFCRDMVDVFPDDSYDIAVTITPYTMCTETEDGSDNCNILGLAYIGEACNQHKTTIIMDHGGFDGIDTAVHEIGHLFGADHDDRNDDTKCTEDAGYIMTPYSIRTHNLADWSACSLKQFDKFFRGLTETNPSCLFNQPKKAHPLPRVLPGKVLTADQQCKKLFGTKSCDIGLKEKDRCVRLPCFIKGSTKKCMIKTPPADGTICAYGKICIHGKCVAQSKIL